MPSEPNQAVIDAAQLDVQIDDLKAALSGKPGAADSMVVTSGGIDGDVPETDISKAEYVPLYSSLDGRKVDVLPSMLKAKLSLFWRTEHMVPDSVVNKRVWSVVPVENPPILKKNADLMCYLHAESEHRELSTELGIDHVCIRRKLPNVLAQRRHMEKKHKDEWAVLREHEEKVQRDADQAAQAAQLEALQNLAGGGGISPSDLAEIIAAIKGSD